MRSALLCWIAIAQTQHLSALGTSKIFTPYQFHGKGDAKTNDTLAVQQAFDAAADAGGGTLWLPPNGTFMIGAGLRAIGHRYDGVTVQLDGKIKVFDPPVVWGVDRPVTPGFSASGVFSAYNVDGLTLTSTTNGTLEGFLFDEHKAPIAPTAPYFLNCTNVMIENFAVLHLAGSGWIHNSQNVTWRNMHAYNRGVPIEETGNLEIGGIGSHGAIFPGVPLAWQYLVPLLRANNVTVRDSYFNGGDDNICIKNDTSNVLVENVTVGDGHGVDLGSTPDCNGCIGYTENITFRNVRLSGDAPLKIKTWPNTTGVIKNVLFEDIVLDGASSLLEISTWYGKCKWCHDYGTANTSCILAKGYGYWGGACEQTNSNIALENITLRRVRGTVETAGSIVCREPRPCTINLEDINIQAKIGWDCANAVVKASNVTPAVPACRSGPHFEGAAESAFV